MKYHDKFNKIYQALNAVDMLTQLLVFREPSSAAYVILVYAAGDGLFTPFFIFHLIFF